MLMLRCLNYSILKCKILLAVQSLSFIYFFLTITCLSFNSFLLKAIVFSIILLMLIDYSVILWVATWLVLYCVLLMHSRYWILSGRRVHAWSVLKLHTVRVHDVTGWTRGLVLHKELLVRVALTKGGLLVENKWLFVNHSKNCIILLKLNSKFYINEIRCFQFK